MRSGKNFRRRAFTHKPEQVVTNTDLSQETTPQVQQLLRTIEELQARNSTLQSELSSRRETKAQLQAKQRTLQDQFENRRRAINKLRLENEDLQEQLERPSRVPVLTAPRNIRGRLS